MTGGGLPWAARETVGPPPGPRGGRHGSRTANLSMTDRVDHRSAAAGQDEQEGTEQLAEPLVAQVVELPSPHRLAFQQDVHPAAAAGCDGTRLRAPRTRCRAAGMPRPLRAPTLRPRSMTSRSDCDRGQRDNPARDLGVLVQRVTRADPVVAVGDLQRASRGNIPADEQYR